MNSAMKKPKGQKTSTHGGKRKNAGRKPDEKSVTMRIPETLVPKVKKMVDEHRAKKKNAS